MSIISCGLVSVIYNYNYLLMKIDSKAFLILINIFILSSCNLFNIEPDFYRERRKDHEFFRCNFNGEEWTYSYQNADWVPSWGTGGDLPNLNSTFFRNYDKGDYLELYANRENDGETRAESIRIIYENQLVPGKNLLKDTADYIVKVTDEDKDLDHRYYLDLDFDNFIDITKIDEENGILIGTFQFRAITKDERRIIKVLDGEFDLKIDWWRPITKHHEFKCLINDKEWSINQYFFGNDPLKAEYKNKEKEFILVANNFDEGKFQFYLDGLAGKGAKNIGQEKEPVFIRSTRNYFLDSSYNNVMDVLEIDTIEKFVRGTFNFRAIGRYWDDTITVSNGYFDSKCDFYK